MKQEHLQWAKFLCLLRDFTAQSSQAWSVYLTTVFFWASLVHYVVNQYFCTFIHQKLTTALLESAEGRE